MPFKMRHVLFSRVPASETYFTFFLVKIAMQNYFHHVQVLAIVVQRGTRQLYSLLHSHLR